MTIACNSFTGLECACDIARICSPIMRHGMSPTGEDGSSEENESVFFGTENVRPTQFSPNLFLPALRSSLDTCPTWKCSNAQMLK